MEDLVVEQPPSKHGITKTIVQRLETIRRRFDNPQQKVVFVIADPNCNVRALVEKVAKQCGASVLDGAGLKSEDVRDHLLTAAEKAFIVNFPPTIGEAIAFEGCFGKPHKTVIFQSESFLKGTPRTERKFIDYVNGVNSVAELYNAKKQLVVIKDSVDEDAVRLLMSAFL